MGVVDWRVLLTDDDVVSGKLEHQLVRLGYDFQGLVGLQYTKTKTKAKTKTNTKTNT